MKHFTIVVILLISLLSCKQKGQEKETVRPDYLSKWIITNEDSLYDEFIKYVADNALCANCDTTWGEMAFMKNDSASFMGRFTQQVKKYSDSLEVTFFYKKSPVVEARILLSTGYNKRLTTALDTILNFPFSPNHFKIDKYEQPTKADSTVVEAYRINNTDVLVKNMRFRMAPMDSLIDAWVYLYPKPKKAVIDDDTKKYFIRQLFGEEVILKKINRIDVSFADSVQEDLFTLKEARVNLQ